MTFKEHLYQFLDKKEADLLLDSFRNEEAHAVLLNPNKISDEKFLKEFPNVKPHPVVKHAFIYDKKEYELGKHLYHELGYYYLQEPSAMVVSSLVDFKETDFVLDMCAAPGGKSIQASFKMNGKGLIISNDLSNQRAGLISNNAERLGLRNILITNNDMSNSYEKLVNLFDKIILHAPCSGSGMFRKGDSMLNDWSINKVYKFAEIQKTLIINAYNMLKPGGVLSYSTCSYSKEEDEDVIDYLLDNSDAQVVELPDVPGAVKGKYGIRLMPSHFEGEGQYICQVRKPGEAKETKFKNVNKFQSLLASSYDETDVKKFGDNVFALSNSFESKDLKIYRYGVKVGEFHKDIFRYDLHYAKTLKSGEMSTIELTLDEVKKYLAGEQLSKPNDYKGYVLLTYQDNPVDIAKSDKQVIKNYYPKGLRKMFN